MERKTGAMAAAALLALLAAATLAGQGWRGKPATAWTAEEAERILRDSPWSQKKEVRFARHRSAADSLPQPPQPGLPPLIQQRPPERIIPSDFVTYVVRWESADPVVQAFARLEELGQHGTAIALGAPPRRPDDRYVVTVVTTQFSEMGEDLLDALDETQLRLYARLKTRAGEAVPLEVERVRGTDTAAVHFFFPREQDGRPLVVAGIEQVEFILETRRFTLKSKFDLGS